MQLKLDSLCVCVECGVLCAGDHPCAEIPETDLDCLGATIFYVLRGEMIRQLWERRK